MWRRQQTEGERGSSHKAREPKGYRSAVAYVPGTGGFVLVAVGTSGSDSSKDGGNNWTGLDQENYNSVSFAAGAGWAAGPRGRIAKFNKPENK